MPDKTYQALSAGCGTGALSGLQVVHPTTPNLQEHRTCKTLPSLVCRGMIKATSMRLKGWDERNGGNLTLRTDDADIAPYHDNFHPQPRYIPLSQPMPLLANTPFIVTGSGKFFRNVQLDPPPI